MELIIKQLGSSTKVKKIGYPVENNFKYVVTFKFEKVFLVIY